MISTTHWPTTGHYKGFLSWRHYFREFQNLFKKKQTIYQDVLTSRKEEPPTIHIPFMEKYGVKKQEEQKESIYQPILDFFINIINAVYSIPWMKLIKFVIVVGGVPLLLVVAYTSIVFVIDRDRLVREEMQELSQKYRKQLEES